MQCFGSPSPASCIVEPVMTRPGIATTGEHSRAAAGAARTKARHAPDDRNEGREPMDEPFVRRKSPDFSRGPQPLGSPAALKNEGGRLRIQMLRRRSYILMLYVVYRNPGCRFWRLAACRTRVCG